ncbi:MAG: hypothetical protein WBG37_21435 [Desulfobacterales bacterium]
MYKTFSHGFQSAVVSFLIACMGTFYASVLDAAAQTDKAPADLNLVCETFCSETKLRTASVRLIWSTASIPKAAKTSLSKNSQRLETTVFKGGFEKQLYIELPLSAPGRDIKAVRDRALQDEQRRAYQLQILEVGPISKLETTEAFGLRKNSDETAAIIDNLEPGLNYTWRIVIEDSEGDIVSHSVTCQAPVCPADMKKEDQ